MTNVLHVNGTETIWSLSDRRLSLERSRVRPGRIMQEDACKAMVLEATDGVAIITYAGLGATARNTEPSDWMSAVLRGRTYPMEYSLGILSEAIKKEIPAHIASMPSHVVVASVLLYDDDRPRVYTITLSKLVTGKWSTEYTRQITEFGRAPTLVLTGSGALFLDQNRRWKRPLESLIAAHDRGKVSAITIADRLAALNNEVHKTLKDLNGREGTVGRRCVVAWQHRKRGIYGGGGAVQFYDGASREFSTKPLPTIVAGMDLNAIAGVLMPIEKLEAAAAAQDLSLLFRQDTEEINAQLARLPHHPDENLR